MFEVGRWNGGALLRPPFGRVTNILAWMLRPVSTASGTPIEVRNAIVIRASAERVWDLLTDVERWPSWYRACRWVRVESTGTGSTDGIPWKAHPVELRSTVVASERPRSFTFVADGLGCTPSARSRSAPRPTA